MTTTPSDPTGAGSPEGADAQGTRSDEAPDPAATFGNEQYGHVGKPAGNAKKAEWESYARSQGATLDGSETREGLKKKYGG